MKQTLNNISNNILNNEGINSIIDSLKELVDLDLDLGSQQTFANEQIDKVADGIRKIKSAGIAISILAKSIGGK